MAKIDKQKRAWGGAIKRTKPSNAAQIIAKALDLSTSPRVLDFGCGHGFDADHFGWESYDPYYRPNKPQGSYDYILCIGVVNALTRNNRNKVITEIRNLLSENGTAFLAVPRNIPKTGKLGIHHSLQNYVVLTLPSLHCSDSLEIYMLKKASKFKDKTKEYMTHRDRRSSK
jgi:2-polyprenyl-3-methyl-5-hydroxy-6-metoxy-1,4-benzoquinol methylase